MLSHRVYRFFLFVMRMTIMLSIERLERTLYDRALLRAASNLFAEAYRQDGMIDKEQVDAWLDWQDKIARSKNNTMEHLSPDEREKVCALSEISCRLSSATKYDPNQSIRIQTFRIHRIHHEAHGVLNP